MKTATLKTSRMYLIAASLLFALAPGFASAHRRLLPKSGLRETYQRLEGYTHR